LAENFDVDKEIAERLLKWFEANRRTFSWRGESDPYKIAVAEILLQKTRAEKVDEFFKYFIQKYPTPSSLLKLSLTELEEELKPLGLHRQRAKRLRELAESLVEKYGGTLPDSIEELLALPGIGEYVANAVLCFAFGKEVPLVDTNVVRVLKRVYLMETIRDARRDPRVWEKAWKILPRGRAKEFNWALIDFAALVCKPRNPECGSCVLGDICKWRGQRGRSR
jgi:A/G-specific adenine glycosylase